MTWLSRLYFLTRKIPERLMIRLGDLIPKVESRLLQTGETPSDYIRRLITEDLEKHGIREADSKTDD
jgi:hypothetical protein